MGLAAAAGLGDAPRPRRRPVGDILRHARAIEASDTVLAASLLPDFRSTPTRRTPGVSAIVVADGRGGAAAAICDHMLAIAWQRRAERLRRELPLADRTPPRAGWAKPRRPGPVLLIDHCDNCGSGGVQDVMAVVAEILQQPGRVRRADSGIPRGGADDCRR